MKNLIRSAEIFARQCLSEHAGDGHDLDHTFRVVRHALNLCREIPTADQLIVHTAALLHDIARPQESASAGAIDHAVRGSEMALDFLKSSNIDETAARHIADCIATHRFRSGKTPASIEAKILYDADKLDSLGATGIGRAFLFAGKVGARLHNDAQTALSSPPYSIEDTAYREYLVKLSKLPQKMLTEPGKRLAKELAAVMDNFFRQLNEEIFQ